jgi:hypothetical protein
MIKDVIMREMEPVPPASPATTGPLFRSARGRAGELKGEAMHRVDAWRIISRCGRSRR